MKYIYRKKISLVWLFCIIAFGITMQGCNNEELSLASNGKNQDIVNSSDFQNYLSTFDSYKNATFKAIESLLIEEREQLFNNLNNDDYMTSFMKKYELTDYNIALQKASFSLKQNQDWVSLNDTQRSTILIDNLDPCITALPRLKSGSEIGISECQKIFDSEMTKLNALTSLKLVGCTCMLEVPIAACICYATIMAEHYLAIDKLVKEKEECERNS